MDFSVSINPLGTPHSVRSAVIRSTASLGQYPDVRCRDLRRKLSDRFRIPAHWITCGNGAAELIFAVAQAVKPQTALLVCPGFSEYERALRVAGCQDLRFYLCPRSGGFRIGEDILEQITEDIDMMYLCNPSNPCGKVFTREELSVIAGLAEKYDAYVITDEVYEHIVYAPYRHAYFASLPGMRERTLSCSSLSKTYSITGWRLGYIIASPKIIETARKVHDFLTVGAAAPLMEAAMAGLTLGPAYYSELQNTYTAKRDLLLQGLDSLGIAHTVPQGAYYVMLDISEYGYESDMDFCEQLAEKVGVGAVPGSSFFREPVNHLIRLHFAKQESTLEEALNRLQRMKKVMKK
jgi:aminotransferase